MANYELKKGVKNRLCNKSNKHAAIHPYLNTLCNFPNAINELESNAGRSESRKRGDFSGLSL